jgi:predicted RNA-binding protein associated with RNAse of E/G family
MKKTVKLILVGLIGLGIVLGGLSLVYAGNGSNTNSTGFGAFANAVFTMFKPGLRGEIADGEMLEDVATYLGISSDTLRTELQSGQTFAQIAVTQGKTEEELITFIVSKRTDELKTALSNGKITQAQYDDAVKNLPARVKTMVERNLASFNKGFKSGFKKGFRAGVDEQAMLEDVATYLDVSTDTLRTDLKNGQTLAQVAESQGKTEDGLINFIVSKRTDELKTALSDGKITQKQYDDMIDNLEAKIKEMVERTDVGRPGFGGRGKGLDFNALNTDIANFIGVTVDDLRTARESGKSLATIATEHGKAEDALIQFIISKETANLDSLLKDGKITQAQYDNAVKDMATRVKEMVERTETEKPGFRGRGMGKGFGRGFNFCPDLQNP